MFDSQLAPVPKADGWPAYYRWNQAIAETVFSSSAAGLPVYLDLEADLLDRLAQKADAAGDPRLELAAAVRATLELQSGRTSVFRRHQNLVGRWRHGSPQEAPPTLALLALLSLAAEAMRGGEGMSANNYYGRLCELLKIGDKTLKDKTERDYRKCAEDLWRSLNDWLLAWEGERGLPTAEALGHRHIGLPISQALIRAGDRRRLREFFAAAGLPPGGTVTSVEMQLLLDAWIDHEPSPLSSALRALWKRHGDVRERVATLACLELSAWTGAEAASAGATDRVVSLRLLALLRRVPTVRLELSLAVQLPATEYRAELTFTRASTKQEPSARAAEVVFEAFDGGWLQLSDADLFEEESLVAGAVRLEARALGLAVERKPRRLVPLRWDESLQLFVEADRVHLGEDTMLLCREAVADRVGDVLAAVARPGFRRQPAADGLPAWVLFTDVQVLAAPDPLLAEREPDLSVLLPATASQVLVAGGLQMPGRARKWSSLLPPEVRVVVPPDAPAQVVVTAEALDSEPPRQLAEAMADGGALVLALQDRQLPDGDYAVETRRPGVTQPLTRTRVRLRSADTPVPPAPGAEPLAYPLDGSTGLGALSAVARPGLERFAEGGRLHGTRPGGTRSGTIQPPLAGPIWLQAAHERSRAGAAQDVGKLPLGTVDPGSCVVTGAHRFELPDYRGVGPSMRPHRGRCSGCGLAKWFGHSPPGEHKAAAGRARTSTGLGMLVPSPGGLRRVVPVQPWQEVPWDAGLDALCHLGSGNAGDLQRIALQLQAERLFVHEFARVLEVLGHVDVERDLRSLRLRRWRVPPPVLAGLPSGEYVLTGRRSRRLVAAVASCVAAEGGRLEDRADVGGPSVITVSGLGGEQAARVAARASQGDGLGPYVQPNAGASLAAALPPLGALLTVLPRVIVPSAQSVERWDTVRAQWAPAGSVDRPGAYKLRGPLVRYGLCTDHDLADGTFTLGSPQVVKHLAALLAGTMHVAWDEPSSSLLVPLGADLPGLYGRAAVLCSGRAPTPASGQPVLLYHRVPPEVARTIADALTR